MDLMVLFHDLLGLDIALSASMIHHRAKEIMFIHNLHIIRYSAELEQNSIQVPIHLLEFV